MMLFLQPQMLFEEPSLLSPEDARTWHYVSEDWKGPAAKVDRTELMRRVRSKIPEYMRELGIEYYDVASIGSARTADRTLYIDYCHMTPGGARVLAERMFPPVYARVLKVVQSRQGAR
jgi:lysophospholipase L1-like esterase